MARDRVAERSQDERSQRILQARVGGPAPADSQSSCQPWQQVSRPPDRHSFRDSDRHRDPIGTARPVKAEGRSQDQVDPDEPGDRESWGESALEPRDHRLIDPPQLLESILTQPASDAGAPDRGPKRPEAVERGRIVPR